MKDINCLREATWCYSQQVNKQFRTESSHSQRATKQVVYHNSYIHSLTLARRAWTWAGDDRDERVSGLLRVKGRTGCLVGGSCLSGVLEVPRSWLGNRLITLATTRCKEEKEVTEFFFFHYEEELKFMLELGNVLLANVCWCYKYFIQKVKWNKIWNKYPVLNQISNTGNCLQPIRTMCLWKHCNPHDIRLEISLSLFFSLSKINTNRN